MLCTSTLPFTKDELVLVKNTSTHPFTKGGLAAGENTSTHPFTKGGLAAGEPSCFNSPFYQGELIKKKTQLIQSS